MEVNVDGSKSHPVFPRVRPLLKADGAFCRVLVRLGRREVKRMFLLFTSGTLLFDGFNRNEYNILNKHH